MRGCEGVLSVPWSVRGCKRAGVLGVGTNAGWKFERQAITVTIWSAIRASLKHLEFCTVSFYQWHAQCGYVETQWTGLS